jgi:periplasmic protein TonB
MHSANPCLKIKMNPIWPFCLFFLFSVSFEALVAQEVSVAKDQEELIFAYESLPEFPGGFDSLKKFLTKHLEIKPDHKSEFITGTVYTRFFVDERGNLSNPEVIRGLNPYLDSLSVDAIRLMPRWIPARQNGKPTGYLFNLPIKFVDDKIKKR